MPTVVMPGHSTSGGNVINVPIQNGRTSVRDVRNSMRLSPRYGLATRDLDGSIRMLPENENVGYNSVLQAIPNHKQG